MSESQFNKQVMVTGGAGFIGSNLLHFLVNRYPDTLFVNVDALTYAGNLTNLADIENASNYRFVRVDICDYDSLKGCFEQYELDGIIHLAAESHVDRSIIGPAPFISTNVLGTFHLLELARQRADSGRAFRFHHVSTDEVFGSLGDTGRFDEGSPYRPNSPYSASKAGADHLVRAYHRTYGLDVVTSNCSNNYGPYQHPEKLIPLVIRNAVAGQAIPVYGDGRQVRDWLYVGDHCEALDLVFHRGESGRTYTIGGDSEMKNIDLVKLLCAIIAETLGRPPFDDLITFVEDRPGHDRRYAIDATRISADLNWCPRHGLRDGLETTVRWYLDHEDWLASCVSGEYLTYYEKNYGHRVRKS